VGDRVREVDRESEGVTGRKIERVTESERVTGRGVDRERE